MNKTAGFVIAGVVGLLILGATGFVIMGRQNKPTDTATQTTQTEVAAPTPAEASQKQTLKGLMAQAPNQKCTFQDTETGNSGTMYIGAGKTRGDFSSKLNTGALLVSHMITTNNDVYIWTDTEKTGFKMSLAAMDSVPESGKQNVDINKQVDYECSSDTPAASLFVIPPTIKFTDYSSLMQNMGSTLEATTSGAPKTQDLRTQQCAACAQLPTAQQVQCKAALQCP